MSVIDTEIVETNISFLTSYPGIYWHSISWYDKYSLWPGSGPCRLTFCFFFYDGNITIDYVGIGKLASLASSIWTKILIGRLTQSLTWQAFISTSTIASSGKIVFLSFRVFLVPRHLILQMFIVVGTARITFLYQQRRLLSCFSFGIYNLLDDHLLLV